MKNIKQIMAGLVCLLSVSVMQGAIPPPWPVYATTGTASGATTAGTNSWAIISAHSANNGVPVVTYLNATGDASTSKVQFYTLSPPILVTGVNTNAIIPCTTNGAAKVMAADWLVLRHTATDTYERVKCVSTTGTTYITVQGSTPTTATALGDYLYVATASGSIPVGAATKEVNGPGIYSGEAGKPLMAVLDGTSAATTTFNAICAIYVK